MAYSLNGENSKQMNIEGLLKDGISRITKNITEGCNLDTFVVIFSNLDGTCTIKNSAGEIISRRPMKEHGVDIPSIVMDTLLISKFDTHTRVVAIKNGREIMRYNS